jgi:hypothetical protein
MSRRNITLSPRYDKMLVALSNKLEISMTETMQRAVELLDETEAAKDRLRTADEPKEARMLAEIRRWLTLGHTIKAADLSEGVLTFKDDGSCVTNLTITGKGEADK